MAAGAGTGPLPAAGSAAVSGAGAVGGDHGTDRIAVGAVVGAVCVAVVVAAALGGSSGTSLLGVREVRVTGSVIAGPDQVRAMAAIVEGTPLARVDTDAVRARVRTLPSVADAVVRRAWPTTLVIEVSERVAVATVARGGEFLHLDREGVVFTTSATRPALLALLRVPRAGPTDPATMAALEVLAALTPQLRERLREIVAESPTAIRLELAGGRQVIWGDATDSAAKAQIATSLLAGSSGTIDVSTPDVVTVR